MGSLRDLASWRETDNFKPPAIQPITGYSEARIRESIEKTGHYSSCYHNGTLVPQMCLHGLSRGYLVSVKTVPSPKIGNLIVVTLKQQD